MVKLKTWGILVVLLQKECFVMHIHVYVGRNLDVFKTQFK